MAQQITAEHPALKLQILGINAAGQEAGNASITLGRALPWLQDTPEEQAWTDWHVIWRDVVVLGPQNERLAVYNLTVHDLARPAAFDSLKTLLLYAAGL